MKYNTACIALSTFLHIPTSVGAISAPKAAGSANTPITAVPTNYTAADGTLLQGYLSTPDHDDETTAKKYPAVIILHDASGPDEYEQQRASILAETENYVGFAADIYGLADRPAPGAGWAETGALTSMFVGNATRFSMRTQAAIDFVQALDEVDETKVAIIGYCMGGTGVVHYLNTNGEALEGRIPIAGAISVHPSLMDWPGPQGKIEIPSLFLTGGADFLTGPQAMSKLEADMTGDTAPWETVRYADIPHAFSNWMSEYYDERADARSWHSAMTFVKEEFGLGEGYETTRKESDLYNVVGMEYSSDGLNGYVVKPDNMVEGELLPGVIIFPYSASRSEHDQSFATKIASTTGYVALVVDIGTNDMGTSELEETLHANTTEYVRLIQVVVDTVKSQVEGVDSDNLALIGNDFGGSGVLYYALMDEVDPSIKVIGSFGGQLSHVANATAPASAESVTNGAAGGTWGAGGGGPSAWSGGDTADASGSDTSSWTGAESEGSTFSGVNDSTEWGGGDSATGTGGDQRRLDVEESDGDVGTPKILVQSGAVDDDMEDVIRIEQALIGLGSNYELTRFSDTEEAFTVLGGDNYNPRATARSMDQLITIFAEVFPSVPVSTPAADSTTDPVAENVDADSTTDPVAENVEADSNTDPVAEADSNTDPVMDSSSLKTAIPTGSAFSASLVIGALLL